jgi:hypothetical protein
MRRLVLLLVLGLAEAAHAIPVDAPLAEAAARHWLAGQLGGAALEAPLQIEMIPAQDGNPALWLAALEGGGWVWLRGDDRLPPVAGWSASGEVAWPVTHPALADWIELQRGDIGSARALGWSDPAAVPAWQALAAAPAQDAARTERDVAPLLVSTWDQGWPWNQFCPADAAGPGGHVWVGCVATAMAQVLYYWQAPVEGLGYHSYVHPVYGQQAVQYSGTFYDWEGMLPDQGTAAAALLQYHCAVGVNMDFSPSGSGAFVGIGQNSAIRALTSYFRFPDNAEFIERLHHPGESWAERLREEIEAGRPVLHRGYGSGGHAFVLDGIQGEAFHLNWGWSGWYNGWYSIDALSPGGMDFSVNQGAIVNLAPNTPPVIEIPDQTVLAGQTFAPLLLDDCISDGQDEPEEMVWWVEDNPPLSVQIDYLTRIAQAQVPPDWTGTAHADFSAIDSDGDWTTVTVAFTVLPAVAGPPAAVDDLRISWTPTGVQLDWSAPESDASGEGPALVAGYEVHLAAMPWFSPGAATRCAVLPADSLSWRHEGAPGPGPRFYRVIVLGQ